jgi:hypothetical protein
MKNNRYPVICEIQNALQDHHQLLMSARNSKRVRVKGQFRLFLEYNGGHTGKFSHIFEIHPVTHVWIEGEEELNNITVDAPSREQWRQNRSLFIGTAVLQKYLAYRFDVSKKCSINFSLIRAL